MKEYKEYKAPRAEVTVFECADDIMQASATPLKKTIKGGSDYVYVGGKKWDEIYGAGQ